MLRTQCELAHISRSLRIVTLVGFLLLVPLKTLDGVTSCTSCQSKVETCIFGLVPSLHVHQFRWRMRALFVLPMRGHSPETHFIDQEICLQVLVQFLPSLQNVGKLPGGPGGSEVFLRARM